MIDVCITIDAESASKEFGADETRHGDFVHDVREQCLGLEALARRLGIPLTFFYPLGELAASNPGAEELAARLAESHELGVHLHRPFPLWGIERTAAALREERERLERISGRSVRSVRAGGYNTGDQEAWIHAVAEAGLLVDSSVWPGASTSRSLECRRVVRRLEPVWGQGSVSYDYGRAPVGGVYRAAADSLSRPGSGPVVEAPIAAAFYEEAEPGPFLVDLQWMSLELLIRSLEQLADAASDSALAVVMLHSPGLFHRGRPTLVGRRLERLLEWIIASGGRVRTLASLSEEDLGGYGPIYAPNQHENWMPVDRADLAVLIQRCPGCRAPLEELRCPQCGWEGRLVSSTFVDARPDPRATAPELREPTRASRYLRAALSLTGGALGVALGSGLCAVARLRSAGRVRK